jgi:glucokinase
MTDAPLLLAGDVGGTKTNLALFDAASGAPVVLVEQGFKNDDFASLAAVAGAFIRQTGRAPVAACFGIAGPVAGGRARMPNRGWDIEERALAQALGVGRVILLNDLAATAYGVPTLAPDRLVVLNEGVPVTGGDVGLIAAGTGLGEAILRWDGTRYRVFASEAGHADFAPVDAEQTMLLGRLRERFGHVSYERVVSGPGLHAVYDALDVDEHPGVAERIASAPDASAVISQLALGGESPRCVRALDAFVRSYGAEAGNLALRALATGGVFVGGGIAPKILPKLREGGFVRAFREKGRFTEWMRKIPLKVILDPTTALRGAAAHLVDAERAAGGIGAKGASP